MFEKLTESLAGLFKSALERAGRISSGSAHVSREVDPRHLFEKNPFDTIYRNFQQGVDLNKGFNPGGKPEHQSGIQWPSWLNWMRPPHSAPQPPPASTGKPHSAVPPSTPTPQSAARALGGMVPPPFQPQPHTAPASQSQHTQESHEKHREGMRAAAQGLGQVGSGLSTVVRGLTHGAGAGSMGAVIGRTAIGAAVGHVAGGGVGAALGSLTALGGTAAAPLGMLTSALVFVANSVNRNRQSLADTAPLAGFGGSMQSAFLGLAGADYARQARTAGYLGPSTQTAVRNQIKFDNEAAKWSMQATEFKNGINAYFMEQYLNPLMEKLAPLRKLIFGADTGRQAAAQQAATEFLHDLSHGNFAGPKLKSQKPQRPYDGGRI